MTADGDVEVHESAESMVGYLRFMGGTWWGHNAGRYDSLQVLDILCSQGVTQSISLSGSRVSRAMGGGLVLRDSYGLVPMGLECLAEMGGVITPKLWLPCTCSEDCGGYCRLRKRMPYYMMERLKEYCIQDCQAALLGLAALDVFAAENDYDLTGTIGGSAWATVQRLLCIPDADFSASQWRRIRSAYYGGRCSVLRPVVNERGSHWDMNSAYPSALASISLPMGLVSEHGSRSALAKLATDTPGIYSCTMHVPDSHVPPLAYGWGTGIAFPVGTVSGAWTLPDIRYAESCGVEVRAVEWAMTWESEAPLFRDFVGDVYRARSRVGKDSAYGKWLRLFPNALCGKFAERPDKRLLRMNPDLSEVKLCDATAPCTLQSCCCDSWEQLDKWGRMWSVPFYRMSDCSHIHWAAYITATARASHHAAMDADDSVAYVDTDSLWTTRETPPLGVGSDLGEFSRKGGFLELEAPAPKCYAYTDEKTGEYVVCSSGMSIDARDWDAGRAIQSRGVMSIIDAARSNRGLFTRAHRRWTLPRHGDWYGDRINSGNGTTRAVTVSQLRTRLNERSSERRRQRITGKG